MICKWTGLCQLNFPLLSTITVVLPSKLTNWNWNFVENIIFNKVHFSEIANSIIFTKYWELCKLESNINMQMKRMQTNFQIGRIDLNIQMSLRNSIRIRGYRRNPSITTSICKWAHLHNRTSLCGGSCGRDGRYKNTNSLLRDVGHWYTQRGI